MDYPQYHVTGRRQNASPAEPQRALDVGGANPKVCKGQYASSEQAVEVDIQEHAPFNAAPVASLTGAIAKEVSFW